MKERNLRYEPQNGHAGLTGFDALTDALLHHDLFADKFLSKISDPSALLGVMRRYVNWSLAMHQEGIAKEGWVKLVKRAEERPAGEDCWRYCFPGQNPVKVVNMVTESFEAVATPKEGDYLLYFREDVPAHIGLFVDSERVVSKWGKEGSVFEHLPLIVPFQYGNTIVCFRKPPK